MISCRDGGAELTGCFSCERRVPSYWSPAKPVPPVAATSARARVDVEVGDCDAPSFGSKTSPVSVWQNQTVQLWLQEWEERQRLQLQEYHEATELLVQGLRQDIQKQTKEMAGVGVKPRAPPPPKDDPLASEATGPGGKAGPSSFYSSKRAASFNKELLLAIGGNSWHSSQSQRGLRRQHKEQHHHRRSGGQQAAEREQQQQQTEQQKQRESNKEAVQALNNAGPPLKAKKTFVELDANDIVPTSKLQAVLLKVIHTATFQCFTFVLIITYTADMGVQSDSQMRRALNSKDTEGETWRRYSDLAFAIAFALELLIRALAEQRWFCRGPGKYWNMFDTLLVGTSFIEVMNILDFKFALFRIIRTVRAVRVLRIIRIFRFFSELRLMAASIISCLVSLTWAFVLLLIVMYIFAVLLLQSASDYLYVSNITDTRLLDQLRENFGDMFKTIYSLMLAVSGGRSWGELAAPYRQISSWYGVAFVLFVAFVIFGVLNILTGVFVESTRSLASVDKELVLQEEMSRNQSVISQMRNLFNEIDVDKNGTISFEELKGTLSDPRVKAYFSVLQMDVSEAQGLFQLLDKDESGEVSIDEFIVNCMRLKGGARSLDMATMLYESKRLYSMVRTYMMCTDSALREIWAAVSPYDSGEFSTHLPCRPSHVSASGISLPLRPSHASAT